MKTDYWITNALIFSSIFCFVLFAGVIKHNSKQLSCKNLPFFFIVFQGLISCFGSLFGDFIYAHSKERNRKLTLLLHQAALPLTAQEIYGASITAFLVFSAVGVFIFSFLPCAFSLKLFLIIILALLGMFYPFLIIQRAAEKRAEEILSSLPFSIDIISSSMNAGLDFNAAVRHLTEMKMVHTVLQDEFMMYLKEVGLGKSRAEALRDMEKRLSVKEFSRFIFAILHGIETGVSIVEIMKVQSGELRRVRSSLAEQAAAKAPSKMIIPMVIFIFPSMFIVVLTPILLKLKDSPILSIIKR